MRFFQPLDESSLVLSTEFSAELAFLRDTALCLPSLCTLMLFVLCWVGIKSDMRFVGIWFLVMDDIYIVSSPWFSDYM